MIELRQFTPLINKLKEIQNNDLSVEKLVEAIKDLKKDLRGFDYTLEKLNKSLSEKTNFKLFEGKLPSWAKYSPMTTVELERCFLP